MHHGWGSFFMAQVGASAALTGLVFVALSINLSAIMEEAQLVDRAGEAVVLLVQPVIVGLAVLAPYRTMRTTGLLVAITGALAWLLVTWLLVRGHELAKGRPTYEFRTRAVVAQLSLLPVLAGAVALLAGSTAGFGLVALGAAVAICAGIFDAWVLLVEILR